jgi:hypothetical protein
MLCHADHLLVLPATAAAGTGSSSWYMRSRPCAGNQSVTTTTARATPGATLAAHGTCDWRAHLPAPMQLEVAVQHGPQGVSDGAEPQAPGATVLREGPRHQRQHVAIVLHELLQALPSRLQQQQRSCYSSHRHRIATDHSHRRCTRTCVALPLGMLSCCTDMAGLPCRHACCLSPRPAATPSALQTCAARQHCHRRACDPEQLPTHPQDVEPHVPPTGSARHYALLPNSNLT